MGFYKEVYNNSRAGLVVSFQGNTNTENYFSGDSIQDAIEYFNMYIKNNTLYIKTEEQQALDTMNVASEAEATELRTKLNELLPLLNDEQAIENTILFPNWDVGKSYQVNDRVRYQYILYKVLQAHTSQEDWAPDRAPSLFARILTNEDNTPAEWTQPDSTNAYMIGDRVLFNGQIYESIIDNNVWSPETYPAGWTLIE